MLIYHSIVNNIMLTILGQAYTGEGKHAGTDTCRGPSSATSNE